MVHLFNRVYLKHESFYDTKSEQLVVFSDPKSHPILRTTDIIAGELPIFTEVLKYQYQDSIDVFWKKMVGRDLTKKFNLFADSEMQMRLLIQFWKSIFANPDSDFLYKLYNMVILDARLKSFLHRDVKEVSAKYLREQVQVTDKENFLKCYEETPEVEFLAKMDKSNISFEYLLANYFSSPSPRYKEGFLKTLRQLSWRAWFNDMEILKGELLNSFYELHKIVPDCHIDFEKAFNVESYIKGHTYLSWMLDEGFHFNNVEYVKARYNPQIFADLYRRVLVLDAQAANIDKADENKLIMDDDQILHTHSVFAERHEDYLHKNIQRGFGCIFTNDFLLHKSNQLLSAKIYDCIRRDDKQELSRFALK